MSWSDGLVADQEYGKQITELVGAAAQDKHKYVDELYGLLIGETVIKEQFYWRNEMKKMRVWWRPQLGCKSFYIPVESPEEAKKIMDVLAAYDQFQFMNNIKPDFCNIGGLEIWDEEEHDWIDWEFDDGDNFYDNVDDYCESNTALQEFSSEVFGQVEF